MPRPRIAITMGDPAGVGPELCLRLLLSPHAQPICTPIVFGEADMLARVANRLGLSAENGPPPYRIVSLDQWPDVCRELDAPTVLDFKAIDVETVEPGAISAATGAACYRYVTTSITAAVSGEVDAVTTGPINKEALAAAGISYPGHTEIYADKTHADRICMMLTSGEITCSLVTTHVGYRDVPALLSVDRIFDVIELSHDAMQRIRGRTPQLVVCGLNPHAGEGGLFGNREEQQFILPAIDRAREGGIAVEGPLPPDTAFLPEKRRETDCYICMYHDQGLIPLKTLAFDTAVNITLGLPIIRTSVDHGTALDIAWQGKANPSSLLEAVTLAAKLATSPAAM